MERNTSCAWKEKFLSISDHNRCGRPAPPQNPEVKLVASSPEHVPPADDVFPGLKRDITSSSPPILFRPSLLPPPVPPCKVEEEGGKTRKVSFSAKRATYVVITPFFPFFPRRGFFFLLRPFLYLTLKWRLIISRPLLLLNFSSSSAQFFLCLLPRRSYYFIQSIEAIQQYSE